MPVAFLVSENITFAARLNLVIECALPNHRAVHFASQPAPALHLEAMSCIHGPLSGFSLGIADVLKMTGGAEAPPVGGRSWPYTPTVTLCTGL